MARLYIDEQFPRLASQRLQDLGHDTLTVQDAGNAGLGISDQEVLAHAISDNRTVVTLNRYDFIRLHRQSSDYCGIIVCTNDLNRERLAKRIHEAISREGDLQGKLIRVNRPQS